MTGLGSESSLPRAVSGQRALLGDLSVPLFPFLQVTPVTIEAHKDLGER